MHDEKSANMLTMLLYVNELIDFCGVQLILYSQKNHTQEKKVMLSNEKRFVDSTRSLQDFLQCNHIEVWTLTQISDKSGD